VPAPRRVASSVSIDAEGSWQVTSVADTRWMPDPKTLSGRTLVVAVDGTADEYDSDVRVPSLSLRLARVLC
jgi:hypothetical protein